MGRPKKEETFTMNETPEKLPKDYVIIKLLPKLSKNDTDIVMINVNGDRRTWARDKIVVMPKSHFLVLKNAKKPISNPGTAADINPFTDHAVKEVKLMSRFAYERYGYIDKITYEKLRKIILPVENGGQARGITEKEAEAALQ